MSVYSRAWIYVAVVASMLLGGYLWNDGAVPAEALPFVLPLLALHVGLTTFLFKCPRCGTSVFAARASVLGPFTPWPHRHCRKCGNDNHAG